MHVYLSTGGTIMVIREFSILWTNLFVPWLLYRGSFSSSRDNKSLSLISSLEESFFFFLLVWCLGPISRCLVEVKDYMVRNDSGNSSFQLDTIIRDEP